MKLDEKNPCPHCGSCATLTDRKDEDFKPVIPKDMQYDWQREGDDENNVYIPPTPSAIYSREIEEIAERYNKNLRVSQDIPLDSIIQIIDDPSVGLDPASQKVYFQLSIEFQIILDKSPNYREGVYRWNLILPDRLQSYGITQEVWERISQIGDSNPQIQQQLNLLLRRIFS